MFGSSPHTFSQRQNIFVLVFSWTWISSPMTGLPASCDRLEPRPVRSRSRSPARARGRRGRAGSRRTAGRGAAARPAAPRRARTESRGPGSPAMFGGIVRTSQRYMASGLSAFSPIRKATVGEVGLTSTSKSLERGRELLPDHRPHLLRLTVVGVVVAGRERVRAEHDPALWLVAEPLPARAHVHVEQIGRRRRPGSRSGRRRSGRGSSSPRPGRQVVASEAVLDRAGQASTRPPPRRAPAASAIARGHARARPRARSPRPRSARVGTPIRSPRRSSARRESRPAPAAPRSSSRSGSRPGDRSSRGGRCRAPSS